MSEFHRSPGDRTRPFSREASDVHAPTEPLLPPFSPASARPSFRDRYRRFPTIAALGALLIAVAVGGYALLSSGGHPKPSASESTTQPAKEPPPAPPKQAKRDGPGAAHAGRPGATAAGTSNGAGSSGSAAGSAAAAGASPSYGGAGAAAGSGSGRGASAGGGGGAAGTSSRARLIGPTPQVNTPEGQRLMRESPDCRNAPPPPPGYNGPVQC
jgi:hypothetical protein